MIRKVLMLALTAGLANKLYHQYRQKHGQAGLMDNKDLAGANSQPMAGGVRPGPMQ